GLAREVVLRRPVGVEVIVREVGEDADLARPRLGEAVEQRLARELDRGEPSARVHAAPHELDEPGIVLRDLDRLLVEEGPYGRRAGDRPMESLERRGDERGGRRLAVRSRDADGEQAR